MKKNKAIFLCVFMLLTVSVGYPVAGESGNSPMAGVETSELNSHSRMVEEHISLINEQLSMTERMIDQQIREVMADCGMDDETRKFVLQELEKAKMDVLQLKRTKNDVLETFQSNGKNQNSTTDDTIKQMADTFLGMDIDKEIKGMREAGIDERTIKQFEDMHRMAKEGTLGDYMRRGVDALAAGEDETTPHDLRLASIGDWLYDYSGGVPYLSAMNLGIAEIDNPPSTEKALAIAKKYYDMCRQGVVYDVGFNLDVAVDWTPDFTGKETYPDRAISHSLAAVLIQRMTDAAYFYTALNAAVFALDPGGAAGAINLATAIAGAGEDFEANGIGVNKNEFYRDALSMYCHALNVCELWEGEHIITTLTSVGALLWDMGNLAAAETVLAAVVKMDPEACDAFDLLYNLYISTNRHGKARALALKSPTRPLYLAVKTVRDANEQNMKQVRGYPQPYDESGVEALAEEIDNIDIITLADYYGDLDPAAAVEVRRHAKSVKDMMKGLMPPDIGKDPMFSSYDAFYTNLFINNGPNISEIAYQWSQQGVLLAEKHNTLEPAYFEKLTNLQMLCYIDINNYLNPNELDLQFHLNYSIKELIVRLMQIKIPIDKKIAVVHEIGELAKKKSDEIRARQARESQALWEAHSLHNNSYYCCNPAMDRLRARHNNELNDFYTGVFANALNVAVPMYNSARNAIFTAHPAIMARIMMISDENAQRYFLNFWELVLTDVTAQALYMLNWAANTCDYNYPRMAEEMEMHDPNPTRMSDAARAEGPSNEDIIRQRQAYLDFYSGKIDENSELYKKMDKEYGAGWNLPFYTFRTNEFITRTALKFDLGKVSGSYGFSENRIRETTAYEGTIKVGLKKEVGKVEIGGAAGGSIALTIDRNGNIVPNTLQWKAELEASVKGGPLSGGVGVGFGSEGYQAVKAELSGFGSKVEGGIEATASKGTRLSGNFSVSNELVKDAAERLAGDSTAGKQASDNFGGAHDNLAKREKTLWSGEYILQR